MTNPDHRPHAPHGRSSGTPSAEDLFPGQLPSYLINAESDQVRELLEELDDAIFAAIAGDEQQLERAQQLWPRALAEIQFELVEESRVQYLHFAMEAARRLEDDRVRSIEGALIAVEIVVLLTSDSPVL